MSDQVRSIQTDAGEITVRGLAPKTLQALGTLFPRVGWIEDQGCRLLALLPIHGPRVLQGFRTGYGWYPPNEREAVENLLPMKRLMIIEAAAAFRSRGFQGVLMPAACLTGTPGWHCQLGELLFLRSRGPLARSLVHGDPIRGYEDVFGPGATDVLLSFVGEMCTACKASLNWKIVVDDLEPCPANWSGAHWRADIVLVNDEVVVIRPKLTPDDPLLPVLVGAGITEIQHVPSVLVMHTSEGSAD